MINSAASKANKARIATSPPASCGWWLSWWQLSLAPREEKEEEEDPPSLSDPLSSVATTWSSESSFFKVFECVFVLIHSTSVSRRLFNAVLRLKLKLDIA